MLPRANSSHQFHLEMKSWETNSVDKIFISRASLCHVLLIGNSFVLARSERKSIWGYEYSDKARRVLSSYGPLFVPEPGPKIGSYLRYSLHLSIGPLSNITMRWYWKIPYLCLLYLWWPPLWKRNSLRLLPRTAENVCSPPFLIDPVIDFHLFVWTKQQWI